MHLSVQVQVTKDVLPYALVIVNPGRQTGWMSDGHKLSCDKKGYATCLESGTLYQLENGNGQKGVHK